MLSQLTNVYVLFISAVAICISALAPITSQPTCDFDSAPHLYNSNSEAFPGAAISYKQTRVCETTPGVRAFSGYVRIPSTMLDGFGGQTAYNASLFFWYFESRSNPENAPLSLYLGGGPGTTSLGGATAENGPCYINPDSNSTTLNPWSWNNKVNMLYLDQPVQVGFSYDDLVASTLDLLSGTISSSNGSEISNTTFMPGILPSQNPGSAPKTTSNVARIIWKFTQIWLQDFAEHQSSDERVSVWTNSYGGHWGPGVMAYFLDQNEKVIHGLLNATHAKYLHLDTLGLTNACIDCKIKVPSYLEMAVNNTYGLRTIPDNVYQEAHNNLTKTGGCYDLIDLCRLFAVQDPENTGTNETVNAACSHATMYCYQHVQGVYTKVSGRSPFDISQEQHSVFPPEYIVGYMNQQWVQRELGVPLNFSLSANSIVNTFFGVTGDPFKVTISTLNAVAQRGVKVALIFGDRDYRCNWLGGEAISLAMAYPSAPDFRAAGYEDITSNATYRGGVVRQHGNISFSRVFQAGHAVGAYQPETVSRIFDRVMFDRDVATGLVSICEHPLYSSTGPGSSFDIESFLPPSLKHECYVWDAINMCTEEERLALANGTGVVKDFILVS